MAKRSLGSNARVGHHTIYQFALAWTYQRSWFARQHAAAVKPAGARRAACNRHVSIRIVTNGSTARPRAWESRTTPRHTRCRAVQGRSESQLGRALSNGQPAADACLARERAAPLWPEFAGGQRRAISRNRFQRRGIGKVTTCLCRQRRQALVRPHATAIHQEPISARKRDRRASARPEIHSYREFAKPMCVHFWTAPRMTRWKLPVHSDLLAGQRSIQSGRSRTSANGHNRKLRGAP